MTFEEFRACALALPGVEEGATHGDPSFKLRGRFLTRARDDGRIVLPIDFDEREMLMQADPETFTLPTTIAALATFWRGWRASIRRASLDFWSRHGGARR